MCKFCAMYGLGEKWYLQVKNHVEQLEKQEKLKEVWADGVRAEQFPGDDALVNKMDLYSNPMRHQELKDDRERGHFGQVVPLEDALAIVEKASVVGVQACLCRRMNSGCNLEACIKFGLLPREAYDHQPFPEREIRPLTKTEAKELLVECDRRGLFHQVFTWLTPYVGSICNCEYPSCDEFRERLLMDKEGLIYKSHYVALIDQEGCNGCRQCLLRCPTGSIRYSPTLGKAIVDMTRCFGCGLCRGACQPSAIRLAERESIPGLKEQW